MTFFCFVYWLLTTICILITKIFSLAENNQINNFVQALETHTFELSQAIIAARNVIMEKSYKNHSHATKGT
jgi:hypothetical protein